MKAARRLLFFAIAGALGTILLVGALLAWDWHAPYQLVPKEALVTVPKGMHAGQVMELLAREGWCAAGSHSRWPTHSTGVHVA